MYTSKQIISWMPHGRAWKIHNRELLMTEVVPKYFTMKKYESFQRQINGALKFSTSLEMIKAHTTMNIS